MNMLKTLPLAVVASLMLGFTPVSQAQPDMQQLQTMQTFLDIMTDYLDIIESTHGINSDSEKAAIMQMQKIKEIYEDRGEKARVADLLREVLAKTRNQTIRNSAYMILGDTLKETGRSDEAVKVLREALTENIKAAQ